MPPAIAVYLCVHHSVSFTLQPHSLSLTHTHTHTHTNPGLTIPHAHTNTHLNTSVYTLFPVRSRMCVFVAFLCSQWCVLAARDAQPCHIVSFPRSIFNLSSSFFPSCRDLLKQIFGKTTTINLATRNIITKSY